MLARRIRTLSKIKAERKNNEQRQDRQKTQQREPKDELPLFTARPSPQKEHYRRKNHERGHDRVEIIRERRGQSLKVPDEFATPKTCAQLRPKFAEAMKGEKRMGQPAGDRLYRPA